MENRDKAIKFIKMLESNGFVVDDYNTISKITDFVSNGDEGPVNLLNTLIQLKESIDNFDIKELSKNFNDDIKLNIDNLSHIIKRSTKGNDGYEELKILLNELKEKTNFNNKISQITIDTSSQKFQDLTNNPNLTPAQKWRQYKNLYNEESLNYQEENSFEINKDYINEIILSIEELYKEIIFFDIDETFKKSLTESFASTINTLLVYKKQISENEINLMKYDSLKSYLGVIKKHEYNMRTPNLKLTHKVNILQKDEDLKGKKVISVRENLHDTFDKNIMQYLSYGNILASPNFINTSIRSVYSGLFIFEEIKDFNESKIVSDHLKKLLEKAKKEIFSSNLLIEEKEELSQKYENVMRPPNIFTKEERSK